MSDLIVTQRKNSITLESPVGSSVKMEELLQQGKQVLAQTEDVKEQTTVLLSVHTDNHSNPHQVTKAQVGLSDADNTSDLNKPVSTATQAALNGKENTGIALALVNALKAGSTETIASLKASLDTLNSLVTGTTPDANSLVDTIQEMLTIFSSYPEGASLVNALAGKVDKVTGKGLSTNDLTDILLTAINNSTTHAANLGNPHQVTAAQVQAIAYPDEVPDVTTLKQVATGPISKFIICDSDPDNNSDGPTFYAWAKGKLFIFLAQQVTI